MVGVAHDGCHGKPTLQGQGVLCPVVVHWVARRAVGFSGVLGKPFSKAALRNSLDVTRGGPWFSAVGEQDA